MLDIKFLRENPEIVKQNIRNKFQDQKLGLVDEVIELDAQKRAAQQEADNLLKSYGVVNGLSGISFAGTTNSGTDLTIKVSYKIRLLFYIEMFRFGEFESTQTVCCRLWK